MRLQIERATIIFQGGLYNDVEKTNPNQWGNNPF